jgi:hypothetical protein
MRIFGDAVAAIRPDDARSSFGRPGGAPAA